MNDKKGNNIKWIKFDCGCMGVDFAGITTLERVNRNCNFHVAINEARHPKFVKPYITVRLHD